jgi:hypothetical protein
MTLEFDYNLDVDQITIIYDGTFVLRVDFDGDDPIFHNFSKLPDDDTENLLKNFCISARNLLSS